MILRRLGNKSKIAQDIQAHFPPHKIYIEPFFGAGGMFFNKPKAPFNICNDIDEEVINIYDVLKRNKNELLEVIRSTPTHDLLFKRWKKEHETEPVMKAFRFLFLANYSFMGSGSLRLGADYSVRGLLNACSVLSFDDYDVKFTSVDFRDALKKICWRNESEKLKALIYADPPYLDTSDNYSHSFTEADSNDLFDCLDETKCKWAMSEFNHPFILEQAKERGLNVITIGERQNLKNVRTEILVTNYKTPQLTLNF